MNYGGLDSFGGATQFAGGGFMNSHVETSQSDRKTLDGVAPETLRSLTVSQLSKNFEAQVFLLVQAQETGQGEDLICDGRPIKNVSVVGVMMFKSINETCITIGIYDGTGTIEARQWFDEDADQNPVAGLSQGKYVRVYGGFKGALADKPSELGQITAYSMRPVEDHNEVVHHNLSVMFEHMYLAQAQNMSAAGNPMGVAAPPAAPASLRQALQPQQGGGGADSDAQCMDAYLMLLRQPDAITERGLSVDEAVHRLSGQFSEAQVRTIAKHLLNEGHVYTTIGDDHFRVIE